MVVNFIILSVCGYGWDRDPLEFPGKKAISFLPQHVILVFVSGNAATDTVLCVQPKAVRIWGQVRQSHGVTGSALCVQFLLVSSTNTLDPLWDLPGNSVR